MDTVDVEELIRTRAAVLRSVPHCLRGPFRIALRTALAEVIATEHVRWVEVVSLASRTCVHREIAKTFRTLQRRSMGGVVSGQRESSRSGEQCM